MRKIIGGLAAAAAMSLAAQAQAAMVVTGGAGETTALYLTLASEVSTSDATATPGEIGAFLDVPDNIYVGLGAQSVTYDLGGFGLVDGAGQDFNVYEVGTANSPEFGSIDVLVSGDGFNFFSVGSTALAALNLAGDGTSESSLDRRSYDVSGAVTASGLDSFRYIRVAGLGSGSIDGNNGFDLDAVGVASFTAPQGVPEPGTWALTILGFAGAGAMLRRRRRLMAA